MGRAHLRALVAKGVSLTNCNNDPHKIVIDSHTDQSSKSFVDGQTKSEL